MNYLNLFQNTDLLDGDDNFRCRSYHREGVTELICRSPYPMLFVLQGALEMRFKYHTCRVEAGNMVVIDVKALIEYHVAKDTVVLIYRPPHRLEELFCLCGLAYEASFSEIVPIRPSLREWIDRLLTEHIQGKVWIGEEAYVQRRSLDRILMTYPRRQLGELFAAFATCALGDCEKCRMEVSGHGTDQIIDA